MKVTDNSADDPVQGYMHDVTYCLEIPMVVKREKAEDDDDLGDCRGNTDHQDDCRCSESQEQKKKHHRCLHRRVQVLNHRS